MPPPDRWGDYTPVGNVIKGTRIVCCKVPLKHMLVRTLPEEERFTPETLINKLWKEKHGLGLVIDLTFTKKYYNSAEFTDKGVSYEKIYTKGHDVPTDKVYGRFAHILDTFIDQNKWNTSVVGVHCTHGVNRTGYLVCRYLVERHNMTPEEAIIAFNTARGHDLERDNYIHDLRTREPGVVTTYDPSASMSDDEKPGLGGRFPKSSKDVENSYSKLKDMHKPQNFGEWLRQKQRDEMFRNQRSQWTNRESSSSDWRLRGGDEQNVEGSDQDTGGFQGGEFGGDGGTSFNGSSRGQFGGCGGGFEGGHRNFIGQPGCSSGMEDAGRGGYMRGGRGSWYPPDGGYRSRGGHNANGGRINNGHSSQDYDDYRWDRRYGNDANGSYNSRGGFRPNRGQKFSESFGEYEDGGEFRGHSRQFSDGYGRGFNPNRRDSSDYRSPMRYSDWSADNSEQYARSGWQSRGRGRGDPRPNRRGGRF